MTTRYEDDEQVEALVSGLENCTLGKSEFHHGDHLSVAVFYLESADITEAASRMRSALLRFLDHHQVNRSKYNETLTVFWMGMVQSTVKDISRSASLAEKCNYVVDQLNDSSLVLSYYSTELLHSEQARAKFVEPDLEDWR